MAGSGSCTALSETLPLIPGCRSMLYWVSRAIENSRSFTGTSLTTTV